jgi:hypothetical protein
MRIESRLERVERQLMPAGREVRIMPPVIMGQRGRQPTEAETRELGPVETWQTYQSELHRQEAANAERVKDHPGTVGNVIFIDVDVDEEYGARAEGRANAD